MCGDLLLGGDFEFIRAKTHFTRNETPRRQNKGTQDWNLNSSCLVLVSLRATEYFFNIASSYYYIFGDFRDRGSLELWSLS